MGCNIKVQRQKLQVLQEAAAFQRSMLLFSSGDTCWQTQTPVTTSGKGSIAELIGISESAFS